MGPIDALIDDYVGLDLRIEFEERLIRDANHVLRKKVRNKDLEFSYGMMLAQIPKKEAYERQRRMSKQLALALNNASKSQEPVKYNRASRLFSDLEQDIKEHGLHLFGNRNLATNFLVEIGEAISTRRKVKVEIGVYKGRDDYRLQTY